MKRPMQKLIAFSAAVVSAMSFAVPAFASAEYTAEVIADCEYEELIEMRDKGILFKNGCDCSITNGTELVIIDENGEKHVISNPGFTELTPYVSATMGEYSFLGGKKDGNMAFDFYSQKYRVSTEKGPVIVAMDGQYAIVDNDGKVLSEKYHRIYKINAGFFTIDRTINGTVKYDRSTGEHEFIGTFKAGLMNAEGKELIAPTEGVIGFFNCGGQLVEWTTDGYYLIDGEGNKITGLLGDVQVLYRSSGSYSEFRHLAENYWGEYYYGGIYSNWKGIRDVDCDIDCDFIRIRSVDGMYAVFNCLTGTLSDSYSEICGQAFSDEGGKFRFLSDSAYDYTNSEHDKYYYMFTGKRPSGKYDLFDADNKMLMTGLEKIDISAGWDNVYDDQSVIIVEHDGTRTYYDPDLKVLGKEPILASKPSETLIPFDKGYVVADNSGELKIWSKDYSKNTSYTIKPRMGESEIKKVEYNYWFDSQKPLF